MRRLIALLIALLLAGCSGAQYKLPREEYRERVQTLGVLPLMVDAGSTIEHPQRSEVVEILRRQNAGKAERLVADLRRERAYFDVRLVDGDPQALFGRLVRGSVLRGEGPDLYRRYQFEGRTAAELTEANVVDGLLVVILNGMTRPEKRWDRTRLRYLETDYNAIQVTAAVVLPSGEIAWEYPGLPGGAFLPLQYPDFDEAHYNRTEAVRVKFITPAGLERALTHAETGPFQKDPFPALYRELLERLVVLLKPGILHPFKTK